MRFYFDQAFDLYVKTLPFVLVRAAAYAAFGAVSIAYFGVLAFIIWKVTGGGEGVSGMMIGLFAAGFFGFLGLWRLARAWVLYMIRAAHVAVVAEFLRDGQVPAGKSQLALGKDLISRYVGGVTVLFAVDVLIKGILKFVHRTVFRTMTVIPLPGARSAGKFVNRVMDFSITYVDEAILCFHFFRRGDNLWASARQGIVLYCQCWKPILANAAVLALISLVGAALFAGAIFVPLSLFSFGALAGVFKVLFVIAVVVTAGILKAGFFDPFAMIVMAVTFNREAAQMAPSAEWEARLESISDKFRELKEKALSGGPTPIPS